MANVKAWERQQNESGKAFEALSLFLRLGAARTTTEVAAQLSKSVTLIRRWKYKYDWENRAVLYDNHMMREEEKAVAAERKNMIRRHIKIALKMQATAVQALQNVDAEDASVKDIVALLKEGIQIERLSRGESTENKQISGEVKVDNETKVNLSNLTDEELKRLAALGGGQSGDAEAVQ